MLLLSARAHGPINGDCGFSVWTSNKGKQHPNSAEKWAGLRFLKPMIFCFHFKHLLPGLHVVFPLQCGSSHPTTSASSQALGGGGGVRSLLASSCCCPPLPCCCHRSSPTSSNPRLLHSAQQFVWDRFPELLPPLLTRFDSTRSVWRCSNKERTAAVRSAQRRAVPAGAAAAVGARSGAMSLRTQSTARAVVAGRSAAQLMGCGAAAAPGEQQWWLRAIGAGRGWHLCTNTDFPMSCK